MSEHKFVISRKAFMAVTIVLVLIVAGLGTYCVSLNRRLKDREAQIYNLKALVSSLDAQVSQLSHWLEVNSSELKSLKSQVEKLKTTLEEKEQELIYLRSIVYVSYSKELESGKILLIPAKSYACLNYTTLYGGYLHIRFSSTGDVYMRITVGYVPIDNVMGELLVRYPEEGTKNIGTFLVAVFPAVVFPVTIPTNICIYNPSDLDIELTIDIIYWY